MLRLLRLKTAVFIIRLVVVLVFVLGLMMVDQAQAGTVGNQSVKGKYTIEHRGLGGSAPSAAVGYVIFDGAGKITGGRAFLSADLGGGHTVTEAVKIRGTYKFNSDGTGFSTIKYYIDLGGGPILAAKLSFHQVITVKKKLSTYDQALEIYLVNDTLDTSGSLDTFILRRW